jgi:hypothetical protein
MRVGMRIGIWALAGSGTAAFAAACNGLTGASQDYDESRCFPLPSAECNAGADSGGDVVVIVVGSEAGLDGEGGAGDAIAPGDADGSPDAATAADSQPGTDAVAQADSGPTDDGASSSDGSGDAAPCEAGTTLCGSTCRDTNTDGHNCGQCGFDCGNAACSSGMCLLTSTGGLGPLVVNGGYVYWARNDPGNTQSDTLYRISANGGSLVTYSTTGHVVQISPFNLYLATVWGEVAQISGTNLSVITNNFHGTADPLGGIAENAQGFWLVDLRDETLPMGNPSVYQGISATPVYKFTSELSWNASAMASLGPSNPNVWWIHPGHGIDSSGGGFTMTGLPNASNLAVDSSYLWAIAGSGVYRCGSATCPTPALWASNQSTPAYIVSDGGYVYWTNSGNGQVMKCGAANPSCAGNPVSPTPIAQGLSNPQGLGVDGTALYVETSDGVYKMAK